MCSDLKTYVCKYVRSSVPAYKLVCELIGARMAKAWVLRTPDIALVRIKPSHWEGMNLSHSLSAPALGSRWLDGVVDITPSTFDKIPANDRTLRQLMEIALFDFWVANEDRNANNANLMYDLVNNQFVSIDYGCIFNTATFEYPLSQLTSTDTILWSDIFEHLASDCKENDLRALTGQLQQYYRESIRRCKLETDKLISDIPCEWNVHQSIVREKVEQLFEDRWANEVWSNFIECLTENMRHE